MGTLPGRSSSSIGSYMSGLNIKDKTEKSLMVRMGTLIDATINAQRGLANPSALLNRRSKRVSLKTPPIIRGTTENIFNGLSVVIAAIKEAKSVSSYEIEVDSDPNFSDPVSKITFNRNSIFKGLDAGKTYNTRIRTITKTGEVSKWSILDPVTITVSEGSASADFDGTLEDEPKLSKVFSFNYFSEDIFVASNFGVFQFENGGIRPTDEDPTNSTDWDADGPYDCKTISIIDATLAIPDNDNFEIGKATLTSPLLTADTSNVTYETIGQIVRYTPIMFFPLFNPSTGTNAQFGFTPNPVHPHTRVFKVDGTVTSPSRSAEVQEGDFADSWHITTVSPTLEPVVWIKF